MFQLDIKIPVSVFKEGRYFIAYTPALDLSTSATTYEKVRKRFGEAVNIFFEEILKNGTLDEVLINLGWKKVKKQWVPPVLVSQKNEKIKIPVLN